MKSIAAIVSALLLLSQFTQGQETAFTYQGRLLSEGIPAAGIYDIRFTVHDAASDGSIVAGPFTNSMVQVADGLFTVALDFGAAVFDGNARWLGLGVRTNGAVSAYVDILPRQPLTASPYAIQAGNAMNALSANVAATANSVAAGNIVGVIPDANISTNVPRLNQTNVFTGTNIFSDGLAVGTNAPRAGVDITSGPEVLNFYSHFQVQQWSGGFSNILAPYTVAGTSNRLAVGAAAGVTLLDISAPAAPVIRYQFTGQPPFTNSAGARGIWLNNDLMAYSSWSSNTVTLVGISNPSAPLKRSELKDGVNGFNEIAGPQAVTVHGNLLVIAAAIDNAVTLVDISNPAAPVLRAVLKDGQFGFTNLAGASDVAISGTLLAIAAYGDSAVTLVDVNDPSNPVLVSTFKHGQGGYNLLAGPEGVALEGSLLAISAYDSGAVTLVDISNIFNPDKAAELHADVPGFEWLLAPKKVALNGDYLAVASASGDAVGLVDISYLWSPKPAAVAKDDTAGIYHLAGLSGLAFAGTNIAVSSMGEYGVSLLGLRSSEAGLVSEGWVGVGTAHPLAPMHVVGNVIVEGAQLFSIDAQNVSFGKTSRATGANSFASGHRATASGNQSFAAGNESTAAGHSSVAMGFYNHASGDASVALGSMNVASGFASVAIGNGTASRADASVTLGSAGEALHPGTFIYGDSQVGGFQSTAPNQFLVRAQNGVGINTNDPSAALHVHGDIAGTRLLIGATNTLTGALATITGGSGHTNAAPYASIVGGQGHFINALGTWATIAGGYTNAMYSYSQGCFIGGGRGNITTNSYNTISGGYLNVAVGDMYYGGYSTIGGGLLNQAYGFASTIGGGGGYYGGDGNVASNSYATVSGGSANWAMGSGSTVGGGSQNKTYGTSSTIAGGRDNVTTNDYATVGGGRQNEALVEASVVGGGRLNRAVGLYSTIPGGYQNLATNYAFAAGYRAKATNNGAFVWADSVSYDFTSTNNNSFSVRAVGGTRFVSATSFGNPTAGVVLNPGATAWSTISDRDSKKNFQELDKAEVLDKLAKIPVAQWHYNWEAEDQTPHIGPVAQEFKAAFYPGRDDKSITTLEFDGVEIAAIQGLNEKLEKQLKTKEEQIVDLQRRLDRLEKLLSERSE